MPRQRSLPAARDRGDPAREGTQGTVRERERGALTSGFDHDDNHLQQTGIAVTINKSSVMADDAPRSRLGRGLASLIGDVGTEAADRGRGQRRVPIELINPNPHNPRRAFPDAELDELASSIRDRGIIQPIVVRPSGRDSYEIIAGERRWRAAQRASLHDVPVIVQPLTDTQALEVALVENLQRQDLSALEEAEGYKRLMDEFGHSQSELGELVSKSRSHIANTLRLLSLP